MCTINLQLLLCNFDCEEVTDNNNILKLHNGEWLPKNEDFLRNIFATAFTEDAVTKFCSRYLEDESKREELLQLSIGLFLEFCYINWVDSENESEIKFLEVPELNASTCLQQNSVEMYVNIQNPELLLISSLIFKILSEDDGSLINLWWYFRSKVIHQRILEDTSVSLYSELEIIIAKLSNEVAKLKQSPRLCVLIYAEIAQAYLMYSRIQKTEQYLNKAKLCAGLELELTGILGKRTKFQQKDLPQLALFCKLDESIQRPPSEVTHGSTTLPQQIELQDDVRLNQVQYIVESKKVVLPSLEQMLLLLNVQYLQKAQPKDELINEELQPFIEMVLAQEYGSWSTHAAALLLRCKMEANNKRTVERAMMQCEAVVNMKSSKTPNRLSYLWASGLQPKWTWKQQLADLYLSLGLVKAALEEYIKLQLWEDVIVCYTVLELRHKAAEVIQQQIDVKPTAKLYCLLGDATDNVECYEKAWQFSGCKSSRAQRHWGNFLFNHKKYEECIPHFEMSLEINSLQDSVWLRLGFAALMIEKWETAATAYRRYTYLQPNSFEAWNNLAKVYVKQGDKERAYKALMEALRYNYDNWKLWENVMSVSMATGHVDVVLQGYHRLLDLREKFEDVEALSMLVHYIAQNKNSDEGSSERFLKRTLELFGRITSVQQNKPEVWQLYADISPTSTLRAQRLLRAYKAHTLNGNWSKNPVTCSKVVELVSLFLETSISAQEELSDTSQEQLSSARLIGQSVLRAALNQKWPECEAPLEQLQKCLDSVNAVLKR